MKRTIMIAVLLVGRACGGWLNPSQPGFTADETLLRIAGDRTNAAALTDATNGLWQALGGHNHDSRYDAAGAANGVSNRLSGALADEIGARAAFDTGLQGTNGLVLFGHDLYRETVVDTAPGWLDWEVAEIDGNSSMWIWAHWDGVILNSDASVDADQVPDFGASDYGPYAWILDPDGNYRVPQEWQEGDHYANVGPDDAVACSWVWNYGGYWSAGQTTVGETPITAVETGFYGSDYVDSYNEYAPCMVMWSVSEDRQHASYTIDWHPSEHAPPLEPWYLSADPVNAHIRIRPVADLAFVQDGSISGYVCAPDGTPLWWIGYGPFDPPVEMPAGFYFDYVFGDQYPNVGDETPVDLGFNWLHGYERHFPWIQVPSAYEVTNTVQAAIAGDSTRYLKGEVDEIAQGVRDDLGAAVVTVSTDMAARVAASTNLLAPTLAGQFQCPVVVAGSNGVATLAWSNSPFLTVVNTNSCFVQVPAVPATGIAVNLFFDCLGSNTLLFTRPVLWSCAPPAGRGLYELYGNPLVTNAWRGWAVPETRAPVAYTQFVYSVPPQGTISNGLFAAPVSVTLGNGATSNGLPATVAVMCREQTTNAWTALPLSRTNLYAGDVYLPFGSLSIAFSNSADAAVSAMPPFAVTSWYFLEPGAGLFRAYPAWDSGAWYCCGTTADGTWSPSGSFFTTGGSVAPGFTRGSYRTGSWGWGESDGCVRSPAITGLISRVRMMVRTAHPDAVGLIEYCPLSSDWTARTNWVAVPDATITSMDWNWLTFSVNKTNGYIRIRNTPILLNSATLNIAFVSFE